MLTKKQMLSPRKKYDINLGIYIKTHHTHTHTETQLKMTLTTTKFDQKSIYVHTHHPILYCLPLLDFDVVLLLTTTSDGKI